MRLEKAIMEFNGFTIYLNGQREKNANFGIPYTNKQL